MGEPKERSSGEVHEARIKRYGEARTRALHTQQFLEANIPDYPRNDKAKLTKAALKLRSCGSFLEFRHYYTKDEYRLIDGIHCDNKWLCPLCGLRWASKALMKAYEKHKQVLSENPNLIPAFLTLTVQNGRHLAPTFDTLQQGLRRITYTTRQAKKRGDQSEFAKIQGMIGSTEVQRGKRGKLWHPHFHAIVLLDRYMDQKKLSEEWERKTGGSYVLWVQEMDDTFKAFMDVFSYVLKISTMSIPDQVEAFLKLNGKQMLRTTGLYRDIQLPEKLTDEPLDDLPYTELLYRYIFERESYSLERRTPCPGSPSPAPSCVSQA
jgi:plasmid rolling circle replication initiator protein Rep